MKNLKAENNFVIILFLMVLVTFSFAQQDSKKMQELYNQLGQKHQQAVPLAPQQKTSAPAYLAKAGYIK